MFLIVAIVLIISMILVLLRLYFGPTLYDRVLASNVFGTQTVLFIGVVGFLFGRPDCFTLRTNKFCWYDRCIKIF